MDFHLTLLAQDRLGGLEVRNSNGDWIQAPLLEDTFIVNLGDMFPRWTNDAYRSSMHRVMNAAPNRDRYSILFFYSPNYHARVACVPSCVPEDGKALYPPVAAGEFSSYKLSRSRKKVLNGREFLDSTVLFGPYSLRTLSFAATFGRSSLRRGTMLESSRGGGYQVDHANEIERGQAKLEDRANACQTANANFAKAAHDFYPSEDLFDDFAFALTHRIAG